jgi:molecular chaperone GrpE
MKDNNDEYTEQDGALYTQIEELTKSIEEEKEKAEKYMDNWRRTEADFLNYKKRTEQEKNDIEQDTTCSVVGSILPVLDDFERALESIPEDAEELPWVEGINLIYKKLKGSLESLGLEEVCAMGQTFEPSLHEAMANAEGKEGEVVSEVQKGYKLKGKLLRPARVIVGNGEESS